MGRSSSKQDQPSGQKESKTKDYVPFTEFPDPVRLAEAQTRYAASVKDTRQQGATPRPPARRKSVAYKEQDWKLIDKHARETPLEVAAGSYRDLVVHLTRPAKTEADKVRAFFVWIASQTPQKIFAYKSKYGAPAEDTPLYILAAILVKEWRGLYNPLLHTLCTEAGLEAKLAQSRVKGSTYRIGMTTADMCSKYVIVRVDGTWRIVNQFWGSSYVTTTVDKDWELIADGGAAQTDNLTETIGYGTDESYFFPNPEQLIYANFASKSENQLLARPLVQAEFDEMAYLRFSFFELGLFNISQPKCVLYTENGLTELEFNYKPQTQLQFSYALFKSAFDPKLNIVDGNKLEQYVFMENSVDAGLLKIRIEFPRLGKYKIDIHGKNIANRSSYYELCAYVIHCKKPDFSTEANPVNDRDEWGPGAWATRMGLKAVLQGGKVVATNGETNIHFKMKLAQNISFYHNLHSSEIPKEQLTDFVRHYTVDGEVVFVLKVPTYGRYIFEIFAKDETRDKAYKNICNYLVTSDRGCRDLTPFPYPGSEKLGPMDSAAEPVLVPVNYKEPIVECPNTGEVDLVMTSTTEDLSLHATLERQDTDGQLKNVSEYLYFQQENQRYTFHARPPRAGMHTLNIFQTSTAINKEVHLYRYTINVARPNEKCFPFPKQTVNWKPNFEIIEPTRGVLMAGEATKVRCKIPQGKNISLKKPGQEEVHLNCTSGDVWEGSITVASAGKLSLMGELPDTDGPLEILHYEILDSGRWKENERAQQTALVEANQREKDIQAHDEAEEQGAKERRSKKDEYVKDKEQDFLEHREEYEKEERLLQEKESKLEEEEMVEEDNGPEDIPADFDLSEEIEIKRQEIEGGEGANLKKEYSKQQERITLELLREATRLRDPTRLETAIKKADKCSNLTDHKDLRKAKEMLMILKAKQSLADSLTKNDPQSIYDEIQSIEQKGFLKHLQNEVIHAQRVADDLNRRRQRDDGIVLDLDKKAMLEISRYAAPVGALHQIMQASLLLLGMNEESTEDWIDCRKVCKPQGPGNLNKRLMAFELAEVHPEIMARVEEILNKYDLSDVQSQSAAAATFFVWCKSMIEAYEETSGQGANNSVKPASVERQKEIFNKTPGS